MSEQDDAIEIFKSELKAAQNKLLTAEHKALTRLWHAAAEFTTETGRNEFLFYDLIIRQCAHAFRELDQDAAYEYFLALTMRAAAKTPADWRREDNARQRALERLMKSLKLAAAPAAGAA